MIEQIDKRSFHVDRESRLPLQSIYYILDTDTYYVLTQEKITETPNQKEAALGTKTSLPISYRTQAWLELFICQERSDHASISQGSLQLTLRLCMLSHQQ